MKQSIADQIHHIYFKGDGHEGLDRYFMTVFLPDLSEEDMIDVIRISQINKDYLTRRESFIYRVKQELFQRGFREDDIDETLEGVI